MEKLDHKTLASMVLFRGVSLEGIEVFLEQCTFRDLKKGEILIDPEKENKHLYMILTGTLKVYVDGGEEQPLNILGVGECVGEMSVIEKKEPSAYVTAEEDSRLLVIDHNTLWSIIHSSHAVACNLLYILSGRVRKGIHVFIDSLEGQKLSEHFAMVDSLTGVHNRRWMDEMFERELIRCQKDGCSLVQIMLDLDHFKAYNDTNGHQAGDQALRQLAQTVRTHIRPNDMVARYGGEEFTLLLPDTKLEEGELLAERLRKAISAMGIKLEEETMPPVTASMGVAQAEKGDSIEQLTAKADNALYRAKNKGRNCVSL